MAGSTYAWILFLGAGERIREVAEREVLVYTPYFYKGMSVQNGGVLAAFDHHECGSCRRW